MEERNSIRIYQTNVDVLDVVVGDYHFRVRIPYKQGYGYYIENFFIVNEPPTREQVAFRDEVIKCLDTGTRYATRKEAIKRIKDVVSDNSSMIKCEGGLPLKLKKRTNIKFNFNL